MTSYIELPNLTARAANGVHYAYRDARRHDGPDGNGHVRADVAKFLG